MYRETRAENKAKINAQREKVERDVLHVQAIYDEAKKYHDEAKARKEDNMRTEGRMRELNRELDKLKLVVSDLQTQIVSSPDKLQGRIQDLHDQLRRQTEMFKETEAKERQTTGKISALTQYSQVRLSTAPLPRIDTDRREHAGTHVMRAVTRGLADGCGQAARDGVEAAAASGRPAATRGGAVGLAREHSGALSIQRLFPQPLLNLLIAQVGERRIAMAQAELLRAKDRMDRKKAEHIARKQALEDQHAECVLKKREYDDQAAKKNAEAQQVEQQVRS